MKQDGKISLTMLERSVKKCLTPRRNDLLLGAFAGRDFSAWQDRTETECNGEAESRKEIGRTDASFGGDELRFVTQSAVLYPAGSVIREKMILALIHRAANDLYVGGHTALLTSQVALTLPSEGFEEQELKQIMRILTGELGKIGADLSGGHTMRSSAVHCPILTLTMIGRGENSKNGQRDENKGKAGTKRLDLILTGRIALAGTGILAALPENEEGRQLDARYSEDFLRSAFEMDEDWSVKKAADLAIEQAGGDLWLHNLSEGGVFDGLWEFGERLGSGMRVDLRKIPIAQETVELSEFFGIHPYRLLSTGALLIACEKGGELAETLWDAGIAAALIGETTPGDRARVFLNEDEIRYMEKPQGEELYKLQIQRICNNRR